MKTRMIILLCAACAAFPSLASAQGTVEDEGTDFGGRVSVEVDKKLAKGLHLSVDGEARMDENFSNFGRYQAGLGMTYKINSWLRAGAGYVFINKLDTDDGVWDPRHRFYADLRGRVKKGYWTFSLKERLQMTHRSDVNQYQTNPNAMALKSTFKVEYEGLPSIVPYAYTEFRLALNDPTCIATWNGSSYSDYTFGGYNDVYLNRVRGGLGLEYELSKSHSFDLYLIGDYIYNKDIDTNKEGTKLKSLTYNKGFNVNVGFGYKFSF